MDYPVLVNSGKPPLRDAHEEENQGGSSQVSQTPQKRRGGAQGRAAARPAGEGLAWVFPGAAAGRAQ